jgi:hypothetical protein
VSLLVVVSADLLLQSAAAAAVALLLKFVALSVALLRIASFERISVEIPIMKM